MIVLASLTLTLCTTVISARLPEYKYWRDIKESIVPELEVLAGAPGMSKSPPSCRFFRYTEAW